MASRAPKGFTREILQKLQELFDSRGIKVKCPICSSEDFAFESLMEAPEIFYVRGGGLTQTGGGIAMVEAVCKNCTYIMFFHAARAGLLE